MTQKNWFDNPCKSPVEWWFVCKHKQKPRGVAQPGSAFGSGPKGRGFKSHRPDQPSLGTPGMSEGCRAEAAQQRRRAKRAGD